MLVELVRTTTRDGLRLDGALSRALDPAGGSPHAGEGAPSRSAASASTVAILLHGVAGNFYNSSTFEPLIPRLHSIGIDCLAVNTRGRDSVYGAMQGMTRRRFGAAYEIVGECRYDLAAWVEHCQGKGYRRVVLIGHSLGAVKAVYAQALEKLSDVSAVVAISPPRLSYSAFMNAPESSAFWESMRTAEDLAKAGRGEELFTSQYPFPLLITAAAYIDKYGPAERYNVLKYAADVTCPALFVYGSKELASGGVPFAGMPEALAGLPRSELRTVAVIEEADHFYSGVTGKLADQVAEWLGRRVLGA